MLNRFKLFFKKNSSTMLTIAGSIGVIATTISAIKATPKAIKLIDNYKKEKYNLTKNDTYNIFYVSNFEKIKIAWKPYIPTFLIGSSTILCIFGSNYINKQTQKSLLSAYTILNNAFLEYKKHSIELYGQNADKDIQKEMIKSQEIDDIKISKDKQLFFDMESMQYFTSTIDDVKRAEFYLNEHIRQNGFAYLNDLYELLEIETVDYGYTIGWSTYLNDKLYGNEGIILNIEPCLIDDDLECNILTMSVSPSTDYIF